MGYVRRDSISNLPEAILHNIMSKLPHKDVARTCVLSKSWNLTLSTFPILVFNESWYVKYNNNNKDKSHSFSNFVDATLMRFHNQGLSINQLKLCIISAYPITTINHWIELANECGVEVLDLVFIPAGKRYQLRSSIVEFKSIVKLSLNGHISIDQTFINHANKFSLLKELYLKSVYFADRQAFQNLLTCCPFIEYITLDACGIDSVCIHGLSMLKGVKVIGRLIKEVEIDAPSLESFHYNSAISGRAWPADTKIKIDKCINIKELSFKGFEITHHWFLQHYHLFTLLQTLKLKRCTLPKEIDMCCPQLKVLKLKRCDELREANIHAPKLYLCHYSNNAVSYKLPTISFLSYSSQLEINVELLIYGAFDFRNIRRFFQQLLCRNVLATVCMEDVELKTDIFQYYSGPPPVIKHLRLLCEQNDCYYLVTSLLFCCRPSTISCDLNLCSTTFIMDLHDALMSGKEVESFWSSSFTKYWWLGLMDVKISCSSGTDGNDNIVDYKAFLEALLTLYEGDVNFRLE